MVTCITVPSPPRSVCSIVLTRKGPRRMCCCAQWPPGSRRTLVESAKGGNVPPAWTGTYNSWWGYSPNATTCAKATPAAKATGASIFSVQACLQSAGVAKTIGRYHSIWGPTAERSAASRAWVVALAWEEEGCLRSTAPADPRHRDRSGDAGHTDISRRSVRGCARAARADLGRPSAPRVAPTARARTASPAALIAG